MRSGEKRTVFRIEYTFDDRKGRIESSNPKNMIVNRVGTVVRIVPAFRNVEVIVEIIDSISTMVCVGDIWYSFDTLRSVDEIVIDSRELLDIRVPLQDLLRDDRFHETMWASVMCYVRTKYRDRLIKYLPDYIAECDKCFGEGK